MPLEKISPHKLGLEDEELETTVAKKAGFTSNPSSSDLGRREM